jgi:hypothetical protein
MPDTLKVLAQLDAPATVLTAIYTAPSQAVVSSIVICNRNASPSTLRVSVAVAGAVDDPKQYIYYNLYLEANDTFIATIGLTLGATDVVRVYASTTGLTFSLFGDEV